MQEAIANGDVAEVESILKRTPSLSTFRFKDAKKNQQSPLNFACLTGNLKIVKLLLDNGAEADLTFQDVRRRFPLQCSVESQSLPLVKAMLDGDILSANYLRIMLREKTTLGQNCLHIAAGFLSSEILSHLLDALPDDAEQRAAQLDAVQTSCGMTPLIVAATGGYTDNVAALIAAKANVNSKQIVGNAKGAGENGVGRTALIAASIEGHALVVKQLLSAKVRLSVDILNA